MFVTVKIKADNSLELSEKSFDITEIVLDNKWKQFKIKSLKKAVKEVKKEGSHLISVTETQTVGAENHYQHVLKEKDSVIIRLKAQLCSENLNLNLYINSNHDLIRDFQKPSQYYTKEKNYKRRQVVNQIRFKNIESSESFIN